MPLLSVRVVCSGGSGAVRDARNRVVEGVRVLLVRDLFNKLNRALEAPGLLRPSDIDIAAHRHLQGNHPALPLSIELRQYQAAVLPPPLEDRTITAMVTTAFITCARLAVDAAAKKYEGAEIVTVDITAWLPYPKGARVLIATGAFVEEWGQVT